MMRFLISFDYATCGFHALQLSALRSLRSGWLLSASYMWSHAINDGSLGGGEADAIAPQDTFCRACERASSAQDVRHFFSASSVYELPFGERKPYLNDPGIMDLTLAHHLAQGKNLDPWQFVALTYACRQAKELLFADLKLKKAPMSIPSRGSALVGGTIKTELTREDVTRVLIEGFMPKVLVTDLPRTARRTGLTQVGLPYAQDPGITRHLAAFLTRQSRIAEGRSFVHPTAILFNGGVFKARALKERVTEVLNEWLAKDSGAPVKELEGGNLDLAVARGAAYYGWVRHGHGIRIRGGTARAYYVGVEAAVPAVPGLEPPVKALCVAPFGMEEGSNADIPPQEFALVVGEPTVFRFFSSSVRREDRAGDMVTG